MEKLQWGIAAAIICVVIAVTVGLVGFSVGYDSGHLTGYENGYAVGHENGYEIGHDIGHLEGYAVGHDDGSMEGYATGYENGHLDGYVIGYENGLNTGWEWGWYWGWENGYDNGIKTRRQGYNRWDPTYDEAHDFLRRDETDKNEYIEDKYVCFNFAADICRNADAENIRCALVYIEFMEGGAHAIVAFDTIDLGLIFIEPMTDDAVEVRVGQSYRISHYYLSMGIIKNYAVIW